MPEFRLRSGSAIVTPSAPGELAGYIARDGALSVGAHDELEAALLLLDAPAAGGGSTRLAWLTLDAIGVTVALAEGLRAAVRAAVGDPALTVLIAASHSHSAPLGWTGSIHPGSPGDRSEAAIAELVARVGELARVVVAQPEVGVVPEWSLVPVSGVGTNRLAPDGPHDARVGVLAFRAADGTPRAVLFDFATHPTVLGPANLLWSADWPGATRAVLRAALAQVGAFGGAAQALPTLLFLQGAAGDVSSRFTRRGDDFAEVARLGSLVAAAVLDAIERGGRVLDGPLVVCADTVELPRRPLPGQVEAEEAVRRTEASLVALGGSPLDPEVRLAQTRNDGARVQRDLAAAQLPASFELPLSVVALGEVAWAHVPLELFASVGAEVQRLSPFATTRVIGYSDGYLGYLADRAAHEAGSYEALSTFFPADAGELLTGALEGLLARASSASHSETAR